MDRTNKMLIDASHPEETRVVVLKNGRVEEFDFESASRKLLRGNVYLAKITRVEPSLQAAFVEYGGNRHGFLAFSEIHPDYYQIPVADREALKQEEAREEAREEAEAEERAQRRGRRGRERGDRDRGRNNGNGDLHADDRNGDQRRSDDAHGAPDGDAAHPGDYPRDPIEAGASGESHPAREVPLGHTPDDRLTEHAEPARNYDREHRVASHITDAPEPIGNVEDQGVVEINGNDDASGADAEGVEEVANEEDVYEEVPERPRRRMRQYKIQEVIKRRQVVLIQVVKEERGTKGAALTTYISLAGRYTVLMPNTGRGGGISRKITQPQDRKRLKAIAEELDVAEGMGLIIRTAGASRTKQEIKRDYEYLLRMWESVRELTFASTAPALVYEEGNLIKRTIRDLYSKDVDGVVVAGNASHREAHDFMSMLMPGHGDQVAHYEGSEPLFTRYGIERQLNALFSPFVNLRSGGYLVINQTEALVAIDINSGKSTREFNIEDTALNTNLEAADEIARQLKLRDLAGLIVVDFIDMEEKRNNRAVERRIKDALSNDRARIQVGRISHFGLLEMSRQRLRTGMLEGSTSQCPHCQGTGIIRSVESVSLAVLRGLEDNLMKQPSSLAAVTTAEVALYILNHKRHFITDMERRHGITITVDSSDKMHGANFAIERTAAPVAPVKSESSRGAVSMETGYHGEDVADRDDRDVVEAPRDEEAYDDRGRGRDEGERESREPRESREQESRDVRDDEGGEGGKRRRRRRRGRRDREEGDRSADRRDDQALAGEAEPADREPAHREGADRQGDDRGHGDKRLDVHDADPRGEDLPREQGEEREDKAPSARSVEGEDADRARRGRRRGRRGGRGRGRERDERPGTSADAPPTTQAGDWGVAEIARPGAEQPEGPAVTVARSWDDGFKPGPAPSAGAERVEAAVQVHSDSDMPAQPMPPIAAPPRQFPRHEPVALAAMTAPMSVAPPEPVREPLVVRRAPVEAQRLEQPVAPPPPPIDEPTGPSRKGWWQRKFGG